MGRESLSLPLLVSTGMGKAATKQIFLPAISAGMIPHGESAVAFMLTVEADLLVKSIFA